MDVFTLSYNWYLSYGNEIAIIFSVQFLYMVSQNLTPRAHGREIYPLMISDELGCEQFSSMSITATVVQHVNGGLNEDKIGYNLDRRPKILQ